MNIIDNLPARQRKEIQVVATQVNEAFRNANSFADKAMVAYIETGRLLTQARVTFPGDKEFGQWRSQNTTLSKSWASRLLRVYGTYGETPPDGLTISTLAEIAGASPDLQESVVERTQDPEQKTPSVREVREEVKQERAIPGTHPLMSETAAPTTSPTEIAQTRLECDVAERIVEWTDQKRKHTVEDALILLGLPPYFDGRPNMETVMILAHALLYDVDHPAVLLIREEFYS